MKPGPTKELISRAEREIVYVIKLRKKGDDCGVAEFVPLVSVTELRTGTIESVYGRSELRATVPVNEFAEMVKVLGGECDLAVEKRAVIRGDDHYVRLMVYSAVRSFLRSPYKVFEFRSLVKNMPLFEAMYWAALFRKYVAVHGTRGLRRPTEAFKLVYGLD